MVTPYLFSYHTHFLLPTAPVDSAYTINIGLQPVEANASVVLNNIFFDVNQYELKPESISELDKVVELLNDNPGVKILISGHTDNTGKATDNLRLSENRAKAVVDYLIAKGIEASRLQYKGFGATRAVADNATEEGRAQNRRTELKVIAK